MRRALLMAAVFVALMAGSVQAEVTQVISVDALGAAQGFVTATYEWVDTPKRTTYVGLTYVPEGKRPAWGPIHGVAALVGRRVYVDGTALRGLWWGGNVGALYGEAEVKDEWTGLTGKGSGLGFVLGVYGGYQWPSGRGLTVNVQGGWTYAWGIFSSEKIVSGETYGHGLEAGLSVGWSW